MTIKKNRKFWDKFYKKKLAINKPSNFAIFVTKFLKNYNSQLIDIGCGNGRDLLFFKKKKIDFMGIDLSKNATLLIKKKLSKKDDRKKIFNADFVKFNYQKNVKAKCSIYSRFTMHTINKNQEKIFFSKISKLPNLEYLFIETRSIKDDLFGKGTRVSNNEFITDHYRRFINKNDLVKKLKKKFKIVYIKESKNFSKFKKENPCLIRLIALKKSTKILKS